VLPAIVTVLCFSYLPMFGNIIAFMDYSPLNGWMGLNSPWVGFKWFVQIFTDKYFTDLIFRSVYYNVFNVVLYFPFPIILALLINEIRNSLFKRVVQTISYVPYFVSWVTVSLLVYLFVSSDGILYQIFAYFGYKSVIMGNPDNFPIILLLTNIFKNIGFGSILYLAAITTIDSQLYEAARIDGAGKFAQFRFITFRGILPTMVIMLILNIGSLFAANFEQVYVLQNPLIVRDTSTIAVYSFITGIQSQQYSIGAAISLFQGALSALLIVASNQISKKVSGYGLF